MNISDHNIEFSEDDLKEIFALFSSVSAYELRQIYDSNNEHYFKQVELSAEYELSYEKREFAIDSLRAVLTFLYRHSYRIEKDGDLIRLDSILEHFVD